MAFWNVWKNTNYIFYRSSQDLSVYLIQNVVEEANLWFKVGKNHRQMIDGDQRCHAREAFTCSSSWLVGELRFITCILQSSRDLRQKNIIIASDYQDTIDALPAMTM